MPVTWLHVSDFHIREGDPYDRNVVLNALVSSVRRMREKDGRKPDLVFATGDIGFSGKPAEYELATRFFDELLDAAQVDRKHLFIIPGNHDVDRSLGIGLARTLESREDADAYFGPKVPKIHLTQKLGAFVKWHDGYFAGIRSAPTDTTCGPVELVEAGGAKIGILPLNSALFCQGDDDHARLLIGRRALGPALDELRALKADINIALVHHPLEWLSDVDEANVRTALEKNVDLILRGHLHKSDVRSSVSASGGGLQLAAGAAYQTRKWPNRALYGTFDGGEVKIFPIRYEDQPREVWVIDPSVFPEDSGHERTFTIPRLATSRDAKPAAGRVIVSPPPPEQVTAAQFRSNIQPRYNLPFVGRDVLLDEMRTVFADTSVETALVLHGQPGVGKSELAREYARRNRQRYPGGTFFIQAGSGAELMDLARIGSNVLELEFPPNLSLRDQCERTFLSLGAASVLLIYDNVFSAHVVEQWVPPAGMPCHVLITTPSKNWGPRWPLLAVEPLPTERSVELIERLAGKEVVDRYGLDLAMFSGGLPVQICPAAAGLAYEARRGRLDSINLVLVPESHKSFQLIYELLEPPERLFLHATAFLNPQRISREEIYRQLRTADWGEADVRKSLDICLDLHLIEGDAELRMHQLFASFVLRMPLPSSESARLQRIRHVQRDRFVETAEAVIAEPESSELAAKLMVFRFQPAVWDEIGYGLSTNDLENIGDALCEIDKFEEARPWCELVVAAKQQGDVHGRVDHESLSTSLHQVGDCLLRVGRYEEARPWYERAVEETRQGDEHGRVDHASVGMSLHQVGVCLSRAGKHEEAQPWYERVVEEKQQGDAQGRVDHASVGISLHRVGVCLSRAGKHEEAQPWHERAVAEKQQGDAQGRVDHEGVSISLHKVGDCLSSVGKYEEAQLWYEHAVEEAQQGDEHGRVDHEGLGCSLHEVGDCLSSVGKHEEARLWYERAVEEAQQGDENGRVDHASVGMSLHEVGECLSSVGKYDEAQPWFERAVEEKQRGDVHGRMDHDGLSISLHQMGSCLWHLGNYEEAWPWYERAVEETQQGDIFGRVDTASLRTSLEAGATCLRKLGRTKEAEEWEDAAAKLGVEQTPVGSDAGAAD